MKFEYNGSHMLSHDDTGFEHDDYCDEDFEDYEDSDLDDYEDQENDD